jgi:hypothetical protein
VSMERVVQATEAVEDLRKALELWCTRDLSGPNSLHVHRSGTDAVTAADAAIRALTSIREQTQFEISRYLTAQNNRVTELLAPPVAVEVAPPYPEPSTSYECGECGEAFPVDPADPIESHGAYLDHLAEHDQDDDNGQGASIEDERSCRNCEWPFGPADPNCGHEVDQ